MLVRRIAVRSVRPRRGVATMLPRVCLVVAASLWFTNQASAQNSSLYQADPRYQTPPTLERGSWTYVAVPPPKPVQINDIIVVRVSELASMQSIGEMDRRKNALYDAVLEGLGVPGRAQSGPPVRAK